MCPLKKLLVKKKSNKGDEINSLNDLTISEIVWNCYYGYEFSDDVGN